MTTHTITRTHEIHAGHKVTGHEGQCSNLHGHSYVFEFTCCGTKLDDVGRVIDFSQIKSLLCHWLDTNWDHRMLLNVRDPIAGPLTALDPSVVLVPFNPTAEMLAEHLVVEIAPGLLDGTGVELVRCTVHETGKCSASYALSA